MPGEEFSFNDNLGEVDAEHGYLPELEYDGYPYKLVATPVQFDEQPSVPGKSPDFNEHGDEILTGMLGLDWDTVIELKVKGVVA